jgi:hypothetical protein
MPTYIIRQNRKTTRGTVEARYLTIDAEGLEVSHPDVNRTTGHITGLGRVVEKVGENPSAFSFRLKRETEIRARNGGGGQAHFVVNGGKPVHATKLNNHVRHLSQRSLDVLGNYDREIEALEAQVKAVRVARREALENMWPTADRVTRTEFEEMVS